MKAAAWALVATGVVGPLAALPSALVYRDTRCRDCALFRFHRHKQERPESDALKRIASAQAGFHARHGRFARGGLRGLALDPAILDADFDAPRRPWRGHWFRSIRHEDEAPDALDPHRFAVLAVPADPSARRLCAVDEGIAVWKSPYPVPGGVDVLPLDRRRAWSKID